MTMLDRTGDDTGFALVDLLAGITVAGLAGSILVGLVTFAGRNVAASERRIREHEDAFAMERTLRTLVAGAPLFLPGASPLSGITGTEREVSITSTGLPVLGLPRATAFVLAQEARASSSDIILRWMDDAGRERREFVLHGAFDLNFAYLPRNGSFTRSSWRARWRAEDGELSALRLTFRFSPTAAARVIVIPIHANLPATCLRNPRQVGCILGGA